ncbi:MAG TPA: cell division protein FtsZ [Nanoarchaeota archaeon]|nr:cell division protein FtsZ [Nanoarchaeota archaeon]
MDSLIKSAFQRTFGEMTNQTNEQHVSVFHQNTEDWERKVAEELNIEMHKAKIVVVGIGGAGCNTVTRLYEMGVEGAEIIAMNTDAKHLAISKAHKKILLGKETTRGLGAGGYPQIGEKAALESKQEIKQVLEGADLVFVTCGLGGGTGTGGAPVVAEIAKSLGAIVIGAVTMPFRMEGTRLQKAEDGLSKLRQVTDTVIVIENQKLLEYAGELPFRQAFALADELISMMIKGITETINVPSFVNLDFADVKAIMSSGGVSAICIGESDSQNRVKDAVLKALNHPLLEVDYSGASGALIHITCGPDCTLAEINEAGELIASRLSPEAQVIWGVRELPEFTGKVQVIIIITGVKSPYILGPSIKEENAEDLGIEIIK